MQVDPLIKYKEEKKFAIQPAVGMEKKMLLDKWDEASKLSRVGATKEMMLSYLLQTKTATSGWKKALIGQLRRVITTEYDNEERFFLDVANIGLTKYVNSGKTEQLNLQDVRACINYI